MPGIRNKKLKCGAYQGWYFDYRKKRVFFTGTRSKTQTYNIACQKEKEHHELYLRGEAPSNLDIPVNQVLQNYFEWGESQGGKKGNPWKKDVCLKKATHLSWWVKELNLKTMADLQRSSILFDVEKAIGKYRENKAGKTVFLRVEALNSFINWCIKRNFLKQNKIKDITDFDKEPETPRRAFSEAEFLNLLKVAPLERKILYEMAVNTGLRVNELRCLEKDDLIDTGLILSKKWTKNQEDDFLPLAPNLIKKVREFNQSEYLKKVFAVRGKNRLIRFHKSQPLLYVPLHPDRAIKIDCRKAEIPNSTKQGKIVFHSLRMTFASRLIEEGANVKELQDLMRHKDVKLTLKIYAKIQDKRKQELVSRVFRVCSGEKSVKSGHLEVTENKMIGA
jgi:integrase